MQNHINPKLKVTNLNRVHKRLTEDLRNWPAKAHLYLKVQAPHSPTGPHAGLNGSTPLTKFVNDTYSVRDFRLVRLADSNYTTLYANTDINFNDYTNRRAYSTNLLVQYRNSKGKRDAIRLNANCPEILRRMVNKALDKEAESPIPHPDIAPRDLEHAIYEINEKRLHAPYLELIEDALRCNCREARARITELFATQGLKVLDFFGYNFELGFSCISWIKDTENEFSIGYWSVGTYASHPVIIKLIRQSNPIKTVRLMDIGAEEPGSYSHDNRLEVTRDQVNVTKKHVHEFYEAFRNEDTKNQRKLG